MKNTFKVSVMTAVCALASVGAIAQNSTTANIQIQAQVSSFDNITCQGSVDLNGYMPITHSGITNSQAVFCQITSNDNSPVNVTAYLPDSAPLTGLNLHQVIPNYLIMGGPDPVSLSNFTPILIAGIPGNDGVVVANSVPSGDNVPLLFWLALQVPQATPADTYTATLTVAITPSAT